MIKNSLEESVLLLKQLRTEMHDKMDNRQLLTIDLVIENLEKAKSKNQKLALLGEAFRVLPWIAKIFEMLSQ